MVLSALPLNLSAAPASADPSAAAVSSRAWLLPLLAANTRNAELAFFADELLPMSHALEKQVWRARAV